MSAALPIVDPAAFRAAAGGFASGVTVVATRRAGTTTAKTVSAFSSLSLDPPLIGASIGAGSPLARTLFAGGGFGVSVLRADQAAVSDHFAVAADRRPADAPAEFVLPVRPDAPVLDACLSWFGCSVVDLVRAGDHVLVVGSVEAVGHGSPVPPIGPGAIGDRVRVEAGPVPPTGPGAVDPLVHHAGRYRAVAPSPRSTPA